MNTTVIPRKIHVLLIDDHVLFRAGLARLLEHEADLQLVAHCGTVEEALAILAGTPVEVVLLDYDLGKERGSDFLSSATERGFQVRTLILTGRVNAMEARQLIELGASGIFFKHDPPTLLARAIRDIAEGRSWFDQNLFQQVVQRELSLDGGARSKTLTNREREILRHVLEGLSNKEIGSELLTSVSSVKATLQQLFNKTGVRTRSQLVRIALEKYRDEL